MEAPKKDVIDNAGGRFPLVTTAIPDEMAGETGGQIKGTGQDGDAAVDGSREYRGRRVAPCQAGTGLGRFKMRERLTAGERAANDGMI
jgi:hypothetical protein